MIQYIIGDATAPEGDGHKIIVHVCNDLGKWGKGFVLALSRRWKEPEAMYKKWFASGKGFLLGEVQAVDVAQDITVINMIGQEGIYPKDGVPPIRYEALTKCLEKATLLAQQAQASVHMPRIGCGLAGGKWSEVESIIRATLLDNNIEVYVYDLPS